MSISANNNQVILFSIFETTNYSSVHQDSGHTSSMDEYRAAESFSLQIELSLFQQFGNPSREQLHPDLLQQQQQQQQHTLFSHRLHL